MSGHVHFVGRESQYQIRDATGTAIWVGMPVIGIPILVISGETTNDIVGGGAAIIDTTDANTTFGRDQNPTTSDADVLAISALRVAAAASVSFLGFATDTIKPGKRGNLAGPGSMGAVRCTSGAIALGQAVIGSATAGLCAGSGTPTIGTVLGVCIKAAAQIGATGNYVVGVLVAPR